MGINLRKTLDPPGKTTDDGFSLDTLRDIFEQLQNPLFTIEELETIDEERYEPLGDDGFSLVHPEFEEFDDPLGWLIDVMTGGLFDFKFGIHIAWNDCEIFVSVEGKISMYEISDDKNSGGGISYRRKTPECQPPPPPPPPPPPKIPPKPPLPPPKSICCEARRSISVNIWSTTKGGGCDGVSSQETFRNSPARYAGDACYYLYEYSSARFVIGSFSRFYSVRRTLTWFQLPSDQRLWSQTINSWENTGRIPVTGVGLFQYSSTSYPATPCYENGFNTGKKAVKWQSNEIQNSYEFADGKTSCLNGSPPPDPPPLPPPPPEKKQPPPQNEELDEMRCCKNSKDSEELLKKILKKLKKVCDAVGVDDLPLRTPKSFIKGNDREIKLTSLAQIQNHTLEQIDAVAGEFPIKVKIKDADPLKKGDQGVEVELPNIAEALAEMYGLIFETDSYVGVVVDYCSRLSAELLSVRAGTAKNLAYNQAITQFLGFNTDIKYKSIRTAFEQGVLGKNLYLGYVKNTDRETLKDYLSRLMYSASLIKLAYMKTEKDLDSWKKMAEEAEKAKKGKEGTDPEKLWDDFVDYLNKDGFINRTPGAIEPKAREIPVTNPLKPQGD